MATTSFQGHEGFFLTAEDDRTGLVTHGPRPGLDGPPTAGPWETWEVVPLEDGRYAFKSWRGLFLSAQPDGRLIADRRLALGWESFTKESHPDGGVAWKTDHGTYLRGLSQVERQRFASNPALARLPEATGIDHKAREKGGWENWVNDGLTAGPQPGHNPLVGQVRVIGRSFGDQNGPRKIVGVSYFPAIRDLKDAPDVYHSELDAMRDAGYQVDRRFRCVGGREGADEPRARYWAGRGVHPRDWPQEEYDKLYVLDLQAHRDRGLKVHDTAGDMGQTFPEGRGEIEFNERCARLVRDNGLEDTIAFWEVWNEGFQNNAFGDDPRRALQIAQAVRAILPNVAIGLSTPPSGEEPTGMFAWSPLGRACNLLPMHGMREWDRCLERSFTLSYWDWNGQPKRPIWQGEPLGDGDDVYMDIKRQRGITNDAHWQAILFGLHWTFHMSGQAANYFNGPAVLHKPPRRLSDEWGFDRIPSLVAPIPEDVGQWPHISHGNKRGTTPLDARQWSTDGRPGVARVDQVWNDRQLVAVVHGGPGPWRPYATRAMRGTAYGHEGPVFDFTAGAGQDLPGDWRADRHVLGVVADFV